MARSYSASGSEETKTCTILVQNHYSRVYWIPACAGMTKGEHSSCDRLRTNGVRNSHRKPVPKAMFAGMARSYSLNPYSLNPYSLNPYPLR